MPQQPLEVKLLEQPLGLLLFEKYANVGHGQVLSWCDADGKVVWTHDLEALFGGTPKGSTATVSSLWWCANWGFDAESGHAWLLTRGHEMRLVDLASGKISTPDERTAFIKRFRGEFGSDVAEDEAVEEVEGDLTEDRYQEMLTANNLLVTLNETGAGNLTSSHDYRISGRGGQGVAAMKGGDIVACFPVELGDQIMLATSKGQSIRCPVNGISFRSRSAGGVKVFNTGKGETVVSVAWIAERDEDEDEAVDATVEAVEETAADTTES